MDLLSQRTSARKLLLFLCLTACAAAAALSTTADRAEAGAFAPPLCNDAEQWVAPGGSVDLTLFCQIDPAAVASGFTFTREIVPGTDPTKGALQTGLDPLNVPDHVTYTSRPDASGTDSFKFQGHLFGPPPASDDSGVSMVPGTATIRFDNTGSRAPKCDDVNATVVEGQSVAIPLICVGPLGRDLTLAIDAPPPVGTLVLPPGSTTATFNAPEPFNGEVKFKYAAMADFQRSNTASGTITVTRKPIVPDPPVPPNPDPRCEGSLTRIYDPSFLSIALEAGETSVDESADGDTLMILREIARKFPEQFKPMAAAVPLKCVAGTAPLKREITVAPEVAQITDIDNFYGSGIYRFEWAKLSDSVAKKPIVEFKDEPWPDELPREGASTPIYPYGFEDQLQYRAVDASGRPSAIKTARVRVMVTPFCAVYKAADDSIPMGKLKCSHDGDVRYVDLLSSGQDPFFDEAEASKAVRCESKRLATDSGRRPFTAWKKLRGGKHRLVVSSTFVQRGAGQLRITHETRGPKLHKGLASVAIDGFGLLPQRGANSRRATTSIATRAIKPGTHTVSLLYNDNTIGKLRIKVGNCGAAKVRVRPGKRLSVNVYSGGPALRSARIKLPAKIARAVKGKAKSAQGSGVSVTYKRGVLTLKALQGNLQQMNASVLLSANGARASRKRRFDYAASITGTANTVKVSTRTKVRRH